MGLDIRFPEVMEMGEDGDAILVFGDCHLDSAAHLVQQMIDGWGEDPKPTFVSDDLIYLPVIVEGTPITQKDAPYPDTAYWWECQPGGGVSVVKPTRVRAGWIVSLRYPD